MAPMPLSGASMTSRLSRRHLASGPNAIETSLHRSTHALLEAECDVPGSQPPDGSRRTLGRRGQCRCGHGHRLCPGRSGAVGRSGDAQWPVRLRDQLRRQHRECDLDGHRHGHRYADPRRGLSRGHCNHAGRLTCLRRRSGHERCPSYLDRDQHGCRHADRRHWVALWRRHHPERPVRLRDERIHRDRERDRDRHQHRGRRPDQRREHSPGGGHHAQWPVRVCREQCLGQCECDLDRH